jgi:hypothetical protein
MLARDAEWAAVPWDDGRRSHETRHVQVPRESRARFVGETRMLGEVAQSGVTPAL